MKRLLIMLVLAATAIVACSPSGSSANPTGTAPAVESPSIPAESAPAVSAEPSAGESASPAP